MSVEISVKYENCAFVLTHVAHSVTLTIYFNETSAGSDYLRNWD